MSVGNLIQVKNPHPLVSLLNNFLELENAGSPQEISTQHLVAKGEYKQRCQLRSTQSREDNSIPKHTFFQQLWKRAILLLDYFWSDHLKK